MSQHGTRTCSKRSLQTICDQWFEEEAIPAETGNRQRQKQTHRWSEERCTITHLCLYACGTLSLELTALIVNVILKVWPETTSYVFPRADWSSVA